MKEYKHVRVYVTFHIKQCFVSRLSVAPKNVKQTRLKPFESSDVY